MKVLVLLAAIALATASPVFERTETPTYNNLTYFLVEVAPGVYRKESLIGKPEYTADVSDVNVYFHSKTTGSNGVLVNLNDISSLDATDFSTSKNTIVIIHGWNNDHNSDCNREIREAYLSVQDVNIFVIDWGKIANKNYITAQGSVQDIGNTVGQELANLGLDYNKLVIMGHSLGAHIAGVAGNALGGRAEHVIGMDPAGPLFSLNNHDNRISTSSGKFVQIIHSNAGLLGWNHELGTADYWPNGGKSQPGCGLDVAGTCAHSRSHKYFAESVKTGKFNARKCADWNNFENGDCASNTASYMGQVSVDKSASGSFFLETNSESPFAKG